MTDEFKSLLAPRPMTSQVQYTSTVSVPSSAVQAQPPVVVPLGSYFTSPSQDPDPASSPTRSRLFLNAIWDASTMPFLLDSPFLAPPNKFLHCSRF
jgi:hypothetical protein